jgi:hypothetical protein
MRKTVLSVLMTGLISTAALAQESTTTAASQTPPPAQAVASSDVPKRYAVTTGIDLTSAYMFRGIRQHSGGAISQPYVDLGLTLGNAASVNFGTWDSFHSSGPSGTWYESDYYASATFTAGKFKPGVLFTSYTSPADSFSTVHELAGVLAVDDSASPFPLSPKIVLAFELSDAQADGGANKGTYLELGIRPSVKLAEKLIVAIPVKAGLSLKDYYEGPFGSNRFGFFDTGLIASVPVVSGKGGALEVHGGVDFLWLGDNMKFLNGDDGFRPVGVFGFTFTY